MTAKPEDLGIVPKEPEEAPSQNAINDHPGLNILFDVEGLHALPEAVEPEFLEVEC